MNHIIAITMAQIKKAPKLSSNANGESTNIVGINTTNQEILNRYVTLAYNKEKLAESHPASTYLIVPTI